MGRGIRPVSTTHPFHVGSRCVNKQWFELPLDVVWEIFSDYLYLISHADKVKIHSFVLMPNHYHLVLSTPEGNLGQAMHHMLTQVSKEITRLSGRINQTFGGPYYASLIGSYQHFMSVYKYVYRNPVKAGLCTSVVEYPYSTLNGLLGFGKLTIPMAEDVLLFEDVEDTLKWLDTPYDTKTDEQIRRGLKRKVFDPPIDRVNRKPLELTNLPYRLTKKIDHRRIVSI